MKTLILSIAAALLLSGSVLNAQTETAPKVEVGLNYSGLHVNSANYDYQRTGNGGSGYLEYNVSRMVGLVADFGGYANTRTGIDQKMMTYLFGSSLQLEALETKSLCTIPVWWWVFMVRSGSEPSQNAFATGGGRRS